MLDNASSDLNQDWLEAIVKDPDKLDESLLPFKERGNLQSTRNVLGLFQCFRNLNPKDPGGVVADKVRDELFKYWEMANVTIQVSWWVKKIITDLNTEYSRILKTIIHESKTFK